MPKRYLLLVADGDFSEENRRDLSALLERTLGKATVIEVEGNRRAVIVKTTNDAAPLLRAMGEDLRVGDRRLTTVLTSGSIGKLKSRASSGQTPRDGQVPE